MPPKTRTNILRTSKAIHGDVRAYLFRGCTIRIQVDESGYACDHSCRPRMLSLHYRFSFLELFIIDPGPRYGPAEDSSGLGRKPKMHKLVVYRRDRDTKWHQSFLANFDFTMPCKLLILVKAPSYENPRGVLQIRQGMMSLCNALRNHPSLPEMDVEPQSMEYEHNKPENFRREDSRGSYFVWQWQRYVLPASYPQWSVLSSLERR